MLEWVLQTAVNRKQNDITIEETINYIIEQIYIHKKLTPICSKLIFRRLLIKLATECTFKFSGRFFKQVDGCTHHLNLSFIADL